MTGSEDWYDEEDDRTFDEQMMDVYGRMADWQADAAGDTEVTPTSTVTFSKTDDVAS